MQHQLMKFVYIREVCTHHESVHCFFLNLKSPMHATYHMYQCCMYSICMHLLIHRISKLNIQISWTKFVDCCIPFFHIVPSKVITHPVLTKTAIAGRPALTVTWTAPVSERRIIRYQMQYRRSGTTSWITKDVTSTSTTLENLTAGTSYQVQVRAVSDVEAGPYSDVKTQITYRGMNVTTAFDVFRSGVDA